MDDATKAYQLDPSEWHTDAYGTCELMVDVLGVDAPYGMGVGELIAYCKTLYHSRCLPGMDGGNTATVWMKALEVNIRWADIVAGVHPEYGSVVMLPEFDPVGYLSFVKQEWKQSWLRRQAEVVQLVKTLGGTNRECQEAIRYARKCFYHYHWYGQPWVDYQAEIIQKIKAERKEDITNMRAS